MSALFIVAVAGCHADGGTEIAEIEDAC
jgi:hypothetical protein